MNAAIINNSMIYEEGHSMDVAYGLIWNALDTLKMEYGDHGIKLFDVLVDYAKTTGDYDRWQEVSSLQFEKKEFYEALANMLHAAGCSIDFSFHDDSDDDYEMMEQMYEMARRVKRRADKIEV